MTPDRLARRLRIERLVPRNVAPRLAALVAAALVACTAAPAPSAPPAAQATTSPAPTATPVPVSRSPLRSVAVIGSTVVASGDFKGAGPRKPQIALIQDPEKDQSLKVTVREPNRDGETHTDAVWLTLGPQSFALNRAKFAVADMTGQGRDDLVALYDAGEGRTKLLVFRSTGTTFAPPQVWWQGDYSWSRARNLLTGRFGTNDRDSLLITYQYDGAQMRIHSFDSTGSSFAFGGTAGVYDSGRGQVDLRRAKFAVGHFTRADGPEQIAFFYQYPNARVRLSFLDPSPSGLVLQSNVYESADGDYDLSRASISVADVTATGKDDLIAAYSEPDGSARVHVFDTRASFRPANGFTGWAALPSGSTCAGATALLPGDWDGDGKVDAVAIAPADGTAVRSSLLVNGGAAFKVTSTSERILCPRWPLTGTPLSGGDPTLRPLYVKIDNNPHARPHYGISKADQVYEWLVEGLTTRLAAVFQSQAPDAIGSVRSARITDTPITPSMRAAFVYSGGGPEELMRLHYDADIADRYVDLSPSYGWGYRVGFREAPYNYFTTYAALRSALAAAPDGDQPVSIGAWDFLPPGNTDALAGGFAGSVPAASITIPYRPLFGVHYDYDPNARAYARFQDGVREIDGATGEAIQARDVVVIQTEVHFTDAYGLDPAGNPKLFMELTGKGQGVVFRDGRRQDVTWFRPDVFDVFQFRSQSGEIVRLEPGQTWIHIVPRDWSIPSS